MGDPLPHLCHTAVPPWGSFLVALEFLLSVWVENENEPTEPAQLILSAGTLPLGEAGVGCGGPRPSAAPRVPPEQKAGTGPGVGPPFPGSPLCPPDVPQCQRVGLSSGRSAARARQETRTSRRPSQREVAVLKLTTAFVPRSCGLRPRACLVYPSFQLASWSLSIGCCRAPSQALLPVLSVSSFQQPQGALSSHFVAETEAQR